MYLWLQTTTAAILEILETSTSVVTVAAMVTGTLDAAMTAAAGTKAVVMLATLEAAVAAQMAVGAVEMVVGVVGAGAMGAEEEVGVGAVVMGVAVGVEAVVMGEVVGEEGVVGVEGEEGVVVGVEGEAEGAVVADIFRNALKMPTYTVNIKNFCDLIFTHFLCCTSIYSKSNTPTEHYICPQ